MKRGGTVGLTQLELLVALAVMGLIAVFLANLLSYNGTALNRSRELAETTDIYFAQFDLRKHVESIPLDRPKQATAPLLTGDTQSFRFFSSRQFDEIPPDIQEMSVAAVPSDVGQNIVVSIENGAENLNEQVIATATSMFTISYFGRISIEPEQRWHDQWNDDTLLPDLIKIEWETAAGEPLPPLTLRPAKTARQSFMSLSSLVPPG